MKKLDLSNDPQKKQILMLNEMRRIHARYKGYGVPFARGVTDIVGLMVGAGNLFDEAPVALREATNKFCKVIAQEDSYDLPPYVNPTGEDVHGLIDCDLSEIITKYEKDDFVFSICACQVLDEMKTSYMTGSGDRLKYWVEQYISEMDMERVEFID